VKDIWKNRSRRYSPAPAIICGGLVCVLGLLGVFQEPDSRWYDLILGLRGSSQAPRELLRIDVDSDAVALEGAQPWSGGKLSEGLSPLVEFGAAVVALDLPPTRSSAGDIDMAALEALEPAIEKEYSGIRGNILTLFEGLRTGSVRPEEADSAIAGLLGLVGESESRLSGAAAALGGSGEEHFAVWSALQGRTYAAANPEPLVPDRDGVMRRISLIRRGSPDLSGPLSALKGRLDWKGFELRKDGLVLKSAVLHSGEKRRDIFIPLDSEGKLLLPFRRARSVSDSAPAKKAAAGPRRLSWAEFSRAVLLEESLYERLRELGPSLPDSARGAYTSLMDRHDFAQRLESELLAMPSSERLGGWREARKSYFERAGAFLKEYAPDSGAQRSYAALSALRSHFVKEIPGSFCLVATAYSTVECRGPFGGTVSEADAETALADSILSGNFLRGTPGWADYAAAALIILLLLLVWLLGGTRWMEPAGIALALLCPALSALIFALRGLYFAPCLPAFCALSAALGLSLARALRRTTTPPPPTVER